MVRRFQFSVKALFVAVAVAAISCAGLRWYANRLDVLVARYLENCEARNYAEAGKIAARAFRLYPDELATDQMMRQCEIIRAEAAHAHDKSHRSSSIICALRREE